MKDWRQTEYRASGEVILEHVVQVVKASETGMERSVSDQTAR
jgi:hypothetical protein